MFSFHKPRIYRSASGCCICRAKSSSSRFTDSRRYEGDFYACFKLSECRTGDICNACVLLVKRWKKLPKGSQRNWHHVVDARAGHGSKPISKINKVKKPTSSIGGVIAKMKQPTVELSEKMRSTMKGHIGPSDPYISSLGRAREHSPGGCSDDVHMDCISSESGSYHSSLAASPTPSEVGDDDVAFNKASRIKKVKNSAESAHDHAHHHNKVISSSGGTNKPNRGGREALHKQRRSSDASYNSFLDLSFWKREKTCCGIIFKGPCGEVLLDRRFLRPCFLRNAGCNNRLEAKQNPIQLPNKSETSSTGTESEVNRGDCTNDARKDVDCVVDSGYDDSSNSTPEAYKPILGFKVGNTNNNVIRASHVDPIATAYNCESSAVIMKSPAAVSLGVKATTTTSQQQSIISATMGPSTITSSLQCGNISKISTN